MPVSSLLLAIFFVVQEKQQGFQNYLGALAEKVQHNVPVSARLSFKQDRRSDEALAAPVQGQRHKPFTVLRCVFLGERY